MVNSRSLSDLLPVVAAKADNFLAACRAVGIDVLITSTFRDVESQNALYAQGRTTPGKIVTNARGGESFHQYRCAFDFVPLVNGKPDWEHAETFTRCGEIAESVGLKWAGRWVSFKELAHCQYTGGLTLDDLKAGKQVK
jgi:peptidoglycan L-alanyl-D-glutamate endopeptidase CwlK